METGPGGNGGGYVSGMRGTKSSGRVVEDQVEIIYSEGPNVDHGDSGPQAQILTM